MCSDNIKSYASKHKFMFRCGGVIVVSVLVFAIMLTTHVLNMNSFSQEINKKIDVIKPQIINEMKQNTMQWSDFNQKVMQKLEDMMSTLERVYDELAEYNNEIKNHNFAFNLHMKNNIIEYMEEKFKNINLQTEDEKTRIIQENFTILWLFHNLKSLLEKKCEL